MVHYIWLMLIVYLTAIVLVPYFFSLCDYYYLFFFFHVAPKGKITFVKL